MAEGSNYAQLLRPVGQALEALGIESFSLEVDGDDVLVRGQKNPEASKQHEKKSLRAIWQMFSGKPTEPKSALNPSSGVIELRYTPDEIERMNKAGQARRAASSKPPEAHAVSQILRAVGAFVDQKEGRFLSAKKEGHTITIEYESALKRRISEEFTVSSLYDYWVRMYLKRRGRPPVKG